MIPENYWEAGVYTLKAESGNATWDVEGIHLCEDQQQKFLVTNLLCEDIPYIKDRDGRKHKMEVGMLLSNAPSSVFRKITMTEEEDRYWKQFMKLKRL